MKFTRILFNVCICFFISNFAYTQNTNPQTFVPSKLAKYKFGMSLDSFKLKNKTALQENTSSFDFRIILNDSKISNEFKTVTFYFDAENNKPLYEMIIEYKDLNVMKAFIKSKLKTPNDEGDKWKWKTPDGYTFKAWTFSNKIVFALALPSTEWDESKTQ